MALAIVPRSISYISVLFEVKIRARIFFKHFAILENALRSLYNSQENICDDSNFSKGLELATV